MSRTAIVIAVLLATHGAAYTWGRGHGRSAVEARIVQERDAARVAVARSEAARLAAVTERALLAAELEDAAEAEPVTVPVCLSPDRVRRLNALR